MITITFTLPNPTPLRHQRSRPKKPSSSNSPQPALPTFLTSDHHTTPASRSPSGIRKVEVLDGRAVEELRVECRRLVRAGRVEEFVEVMESLSDYQSQIKDIVDPIEILKIFVEKHDPFMAVRYASIYSHSQFLFCSIIHEFGKRKDLTSALKAFEDIKKKKGGFNMFICRSIIDACGHCSDPLKSRDIFQELLSEKIIPNAHVFNSLMNVNAHDLTYILYAYKHMQDLGVMADMTSYNILLKACCLAKRIDLAQKIYKEIKTLERTESLQLDVITYSTMIKAFADAKMPQMALNIKEEMLLAGVTPNVITWSSLISACAKAGLVDQALKVFDDMLLTGCEPNSQCCNNMLYACVQSCQYDRAFRLFNTWKFRGFRISNSIKNVEHGKRNQSQDLKPLNCTTQKGYTSINRQIGVTKVVYFKPTVATYNILMKACGSNYYHAKRLMDEMKIMGLSPNQISWSTLIDICGSTQNVSAAMQAFNAMRGSGIKPDVIAYTSVIKACVESENVMLAFSLFEEMKRYRMQPNKITYSTLLRARRRYGSLYEVQQCLAIYQDMRKAGYRSNDYFLKELLEEWCEGVISRRAENQVTLCLGKSCRKVDNKTQSLLLEKIAVHLQKDFCEDTAIDLRGLTPVEARIVVLSVLRMIKENYGLGYPVKDGVVIITGVERNAPGTGTPEYEVQRAITKVLKDELGLDVLTGPTSAAIKGKAAANTGNPQPLMNLESSNLKRAVARRPEEFGVLTVTRTSLCHWLQKKCRN